MLKLKKFFGFVIIVLMASNSWSATKVALTMKSKGDVKVITAATGGQEKLLRGSSLFDRDRVKTGTDGNVILVFLDDKTQLKLKGNSETEIIGTRGKDGISKRVNIEYGSLKASISKQKGEFIISTPTSVASVKGTEFWMISDPDSGDILINLSGSVELTNVYTGETMVVEAGVVTLSTPDGEIKVLKVVRIIGDAVADPSGGQFGLSSIIILEGEAESGDLSGLIVFDENTIFEGAEVTTGKKVTVLGVLDTDDGNIYATLIEISEPINIEAIATSSVTNDEFTIGDVMLISGETESLPTKVKITTSTSVVGGEVIAGAEVTVSGNYNDETGVIEATTIIVVIPELKVTGQVSSIISDTEFEISEIVIVDGNVDPSALSGAVVIVEGATLEGGDLAVGVKVIVTGMLDEGTGAINANRVVISQVVIEAIATSGIEDNKFEVREISVLDGDVDPSTLSGVVITGENTDMDEGFLLPGVKMTISGSVDEGTGDFLALSITIPELQLSGTVSNVISDSEFEISNIELLDGDADESALSGRIIIPEWVSVEGADLETGAKVAVTGVLNEDDGSVIARQVVVILITIEATATSGIMNNQFEIDIDNVTVIEGDLDPSILSGVVKAAMDLVIEGFDIGVRLKITGSVEEGTGDFLASEAVVIEDQEEQELIFELENNQGNRKELIIKIQ